MDRSNFSSYFKKLNNKLGSNVLQSEKKLNSGILLSHKNIDLEGFKEHMESDSDLSNSSSSSSEMLEMDIRKKIEKSSIPKLSESNSSLRQSGLSIEEGNMMMNVPKLDPIRKFSGIQGKNSVSSLSSK